MSSSNALTTASGSGVGWQVDIPSLSSLVYRLGSAGMRQLAQAGVAPHTIACMDEIAEMCPASMGYRKELSNARCGQRKQSQMFYNVIEIGAATNFVADQLLKTRAGENVVALMSTILPVMSGNTCDFLLLKLFEARAVPHDKTPGFGQLRAIRESLSSLSQKMDFKDKMFEYHTLTKHLLKRNLITADFPAYKGIPDYETAAKLITAFSSLTQDPLLVLDYHGLVGSSWVISYARHILGLPVCILESPSSTVPISEGYQNARVLVHIYGEESKCSISKKADLLDMFVTGSFGENTWTVDIRRINVFNSYMPPVENLREFLSKLAFSVILETTESLAMSLYRETLHPEQQITDADSHGFTSYFEYCLPRIKERARAMLLDLGFVQPETPEIEKRSGCEHFRMSQAGHNFRDFVTALISNVACDNVGLGLEEGLEKVRDDYLYEMSHGYIITVFNLAHAAACLALTNWHQDISTISVAFLESRTFLHNLRLPLYDKTNSVYDTRMNALCNMAFYVTTGDQLKAPELDERLLLAFEHRNIVFAHHAALHLKFDLEAQLLHLFVGRIMIGGEPTAKVYTDDSVTPHDLSTSDQQTQSTKTTAYDALRIYKPTNMFPRIEIPGRIELTGYDITVKHNALVDNMVYGLGSPQEITWGLRQMLVTGTCDHSYLDELQISSNDLRIGLAPSTPDPREKRAEYRDYIQAVDQNPQGQWLAFQNYWIDENGEASVKKITILQRDCCLRCTIDRAKKWLSSGSSKDPKYFRIIHGRLEGEEMD